MDQHIGNYIQEFVGDKYWEFGEELLDEIDAGRRNASDKIGSKKLRELVCQWTSEAVIAANESPNKFRHAWINFGLYLPLDGSKDSDESTIVK